MQNLTKNKLAIFDFCGTLVDLQSAGLFCDYCYARISKANLLTAVVAVIYNILSRVPILRNSSITKKLCLYRLRGIKKSFLTKIACDFVKNVLQPHQSTYVIKELTKRKSAGYKVVIASAGYDIYIEKFLHPIQEILILANKLSYSKDTFTGTLNGADCRGAEKLKRLVSSVDVSRVNLGESVVYTDSLSEDSALVGFVGTTFLVKGGVCEKIK